jgi:5-methylcytosine-specific restriction endonuclease McrA
MAVLCEEFRMPSPDLGPVPKRPKRPAPIRGDRLVSHPRSRDSFLQSYRWKKLRMEAIKKYGARCQCCGASSQTGAVINVDHIKPRKLYPALALDINNLQILCHECNHGKGNWDMTDWRQREEAKAGN